LLADLIVKLRTELQNHQQANQRPHPLHVVKTIRNFLVSSYHIIIS
jgi:hypothetical protein